MKRVSGATLLLSCVLALMIAPSLLAQDFSRLFEAVDKLESNLKKLVQEEAATREKEIAGLRSEIGAARANGELPTSDADLAELRADIESIKQQLASAPSRSSDGSYSVSGQDIAALVSTVEALRSEVSYLKSQYEGQGEQLASLEDAATRPAGSQSPELAALTDKVTALNISIEGLVAKDNSNKSKDFPTVSKGDITIGGLVQEQYFANTDPNYKSTFALQKARLVASGRINDYAKMSFVAEFAGTPKLLDGYLTLTPGKLWAFRLGQFQRPFGTEFLTPAANLPFISYARLSRLETNRDIGFDLAFSPSFSKMAGMRIVAGLFNGSGINTSDANPDKNFVSRVEFSFAKMFLVASNFAVGSNNEPDPAKTSRTNAYGASITWNWKNEIVETEMIRSKEGIGEKLGWAIWGGHTFQTGLKVLPEIQALTRYEQYDPSLDISGDRSSVVTLGTNLFIDKKYTKIQLNYLLVGEQTKSVDNNEFQMNCQVAF